MSKPIVALIGRPNVGKSTFFNYIIGERKSIVEDTPGVTRDRIYADTEWRGRKFTLIDTGGIEPKSNNEILVQMKQQAEIAMETSDLILFLTDIKQGVTANDYEVATMLRKTGKPVILVCNKADKIGETPAELYEFYNLGLGDPYPVSSINKLGTGELLDAIYDLLPEEDDGLQDDEYINVAVIGKPNAGKSSLINKILGEKRLIVSNIAGTTRDAIDSKFENNHGKYIFIDTAGIRRKSKIEEEIERYSIIRAKASIEKADVCILVIDATEGITDQDAKIAGEAHESGKGVIILINKWDAVEKETGSLENYKKEVYQKLAYLSYAPTLFVSALTGQRVDKLFPLINSVNEQNAKRVTTGMLNDVINEAVTLVQPPSDKGRRLKIYYATQVSTRPPTFIVFCNSTKLFHFSYQRYIENQLRKNFGFDGTPIRIIPREKTDKDAEKGRK
ncbi:MAG: ribosome biogenesis GTPase Der [Clostridia bacterium]|nr:ribosome biogenesis GTPase Der [Clostridia bacterium]